MFVFVSYLISSLCCLHFPMIVEFLRLPGNDLSGTIPTQLGQLERLGKNSVLADGMLLHCF